MIMKSGNAVALGMKMADNLQGAAAAKIPGTQGTIAAQVEKEKKET